MVRWHNTKSIYTIFLSQLNVEARNLRRFPHEELPLSFLSQKAYLGEQV